MAVKLVGVIFALLIELVVIILILLIEILADVIFILLLEKPYINDRASKYYPHSINRSANRCYPCITIENH